MGRDTNALHNVELLTCEEIQSPGGSSLTPLWSGRLSSLGILEPLANISGPELSPSQPPWRSQAQDPEGLAVQNLAPGPLKPDVEADTFPRCGWGLDTLDPVDPSLTALNAGFSTR